MRRRKPTSWLAAPLLWLALSVPAGAQSGRTDAARIDTIKEVFARLLACWKPPPLSQASPIDVTVIVSFNRQGAILGRPRITYESEQGSDNDRLQYRIAVMETLQRCTPLPFTDALGGAVAGRPFAVPFRTRKTQPKSPERQAWLLPKIL